jgi:hypothetical protein
MPPGLLARADETIEQQVNVAFCDRTPHSRFDPTLPSASISCCGSKADFSLFQNGNLSVAAGRNKAA